MCTTCWIANPGENTSNLSSDSSHTVEKLTEELWYVVSALVHRPALEVKVTQSSGTTAGLPEVPVLLSKQGVIKVRVVQEQRAAPQSGCFREQGTTGGVKRREEGKENKRSKTAVLPGIGAYFDE